MFLILHLALAQAATLTTTQTNPTSLALGATTPIGWVLSAGTWDCTLTSYAGLFKFTTFGTATLHDSYLPGSLSYITWYSKLRMSGTDSVLNPIFASSNIVYKAQYYYVNTSDTITSASTDYVEMTCNDGTNVLQTQSIFGLNGGWVPYCQPTNPCQNGGNCNPLNGTCSCYWPYYGPTCSLIDCGWCHNGGICNTGTGICACPTGYYGNNCEFAYCPKGSASTNCNSGVCDIYSGTCTCFSGYFGESCTLKQCLNNCNSQGVCDYTTGTCTCYTNFYGQDCSYARCPRDCGAFGGCNLSTGKCNCYGIVGQEDCMFYSCPNSCSSKGYCNSYSGECVCNAGYTGADCSLTQT